jgi:hypothetical protein
METAIARMKFALDTLPRRLRAITEQQSQQRPAPDRWTTKEVIGHLIDSAANNHQRFVRGQLADRSEFPGYEHEAWVRLQAYQDADWNALIRLWHSYNTHLLHVIEHMSSGNLNNQCRVGGGEWLSLTALFVDYVDHLEHHLRKVFGNWDAPV